MTECDRSDDMPMCYFVAEHASAEFFNSF